MAIGLSRFDDGFRQETREKLARIIDHIATIERAGGMDSGDASTALNDILSLIHSIKGAARMMGYAGIDTVCHLAEDMLVKARRDGNVTRHTLLALDEAQQGIDRLLSSLNVPEEGTAAEWLCLLESRLKEAADMEIGGPPPVVPPADTMVVNSIKSLPPFVPLSEELVHTIRVPVDTLDDILHQNRELAQAADSLGRLSLELDSLLNVTPQESAAAKLTETVGIVRLSETLRSDIERISAIARTLERSTIALRMRPLNDLFLHLTAQVQELARGLGKSANVDCTGGELILDGRIVSMLGEVMIHLIRNAVDHGIEPAEQRLEAGKNPDGWIWVSARENAGWARITVADDGQGIDPGIIWLRAAELVLTAGVAPPARVTKEAFQFLFDDRFTTRTGATAISGRGVGLAAVRRRIQELGGDVSVESEPGLVSRFIITVPTLLSSQRLIVGRANLNGRSVCIGFPSAMVLDQPEPRDPTGVAGLFAGNGHGGYAPAYSLSQILQNGVLREAQEERFELAINDGVRSARIATSEIITETNAVIEPLPELGRDARLIAGAAAWANDEVMLVVNIPAILSQIYAAAKPTPPL